MILAAGSAGEAKALGREVRGFVDEVWDAARVDILRRGSVAKFGSSEALRSYLVGTGDRVSIDTSPIDRVWGVGLTGDNPSIERPSEWRGSNLLGYALMQARAELR